MNSRSSKKAEKPRPYCLVNLESHVVLKREDKVPHSVATLNSVLSRQKSTLTWIAAEFLPADYSSRAKS